MSSTSFGVGHGTERPAPPPSFCDQAYSSLRAPAPTERLPLPRSHRLAVRCRHVERALRRGAAELVDAIADAPSGGAGSARAQRLRARMEALAGRAEALAVALALGDAPRQAERDLAKLEREASRALRRARALALDLYWLDLGEAG